MGSSWTRARTRVPCIGRRILNHCATREVPSLKLLCLSNSQSLFLVASSRLGRAKTHYCSKGMGNAHTHVQAPKGLLIACPFRSPVQANWKPDLQAATGKGRMLALQSSPYQRETRSWVFEPIHSVLSQRESLLGTLVQPYKNASLFSVVSGDS